MSKQSGKFSEKINSKSINYEKLKFKNSILLSLSEMWERFSYYGMRSLIVLFLVKQLGYSDANAVVTYSVFAAIGYAGPIVAGLLADRIVGFRNMIIIGGTIMVLGHISMVLIPVESNLIYLGLAAVAIGTGMFKGNISSLLGTLYKAGDPDRDKGFTIFYVGINLGGFIAPIICGYITYFYGAHYGFAIAGIGMFIGLMLFIYTQKFLGDKGLAPDPAYLNKRIFMGLKPVALIYIGCVAAILISTLVIYNSESFKMIMIFFAIIGFLIYGRIVYKSSSEDQRKLIALSIMMVFFMLFFVVEMQLASLIVLFTDRNVVDSIFGIIVPAEVSQSINPFVIIVFGLILGFLIRINIRYSILKFAFGILAMALSMLFLWIGCLNADSSFKVPYIYFFTGIAIMSIGELLIAPFIQAQATLLAPEKLKGVIMGFIMFSLAVSNLGGFVLKSFMSVPEGSTDLSVSLEIYKNGFFIIFIAFIVFFIIFLSFYKYILNVIMENNFKGKASK